MREMPKKEPRIRAALVILPHYTRLEKISSSDYYQPVIVQYMKYLYPRGLEKKP